MYIYIFFFFFIFWVRKKFFLLISLGFTHAGAFIWQVWLKAGLVGMAGIIGDLSPFDLFTHSIKKCSLFFHVVTTSKPRYVIIYHVMHVDIPVAMIV